MRTIRRVRMDLQRSDRESTKKATITKFPRTRSRKKVKKMEMLMKKKERMTMITVKLNSRWIRRMS